MKHWGKSVIQEQQINILKIYILKYTGFFTVLGQSLEHVRL